MLNHSLFKSLLFFGAGAVLTATGERDMEHLGGLIHRMPLTAFAFLVGCVGDLGAAAAQRLRLRVADLPGDPGQPGAAAMGPEVPGAGGRRAAGAVGGARRRLLRQGLRHHLPRPAAHARPPSSAQEVDRFSLAAMFALAALCLLAGMLPGFVIDALAPVVQALVGARMPAQAASPWLSIVPIAESRSSYNGLLVFVFIAVSATLAACVDPSLRLARAAPQRRPGTAAFPIRARRRSTPAGSFAQPIRRVFGTLRVPGPRARSTCRRPATPRRRASRSSCATWSGSGSTRRSPALVGCAADRLNHLQFLTIRRYLSLVFVALVVLLLVLALWR